MRSNLNINITCKYRAPAVKRKHSVRAKKVMIPWNMSERTFKYFVVLLSGFQLKYLK